MALLGWTETRVLVQSRGLTTPRLGASPNAKVLIMSIRTRRALAVAAVLAITMALTRTALPQGAASEKSVVNFENSCAARVQKDLQAAMARLHSFEARPDTFRAVAKKDKRCAIAWWAGAMVARGNPLGGDFDADALKSGRALLERAKRLKATPRERAFIDALAVYYRDFPSQAERTLAYEAAMEKLAADYPADVEARIFYALAILETVDLFDKTYARQLKAGAILEAIWRDHPEHPGAPHYLIHAYDYAPLAERALLAARRYAALETSSPHARHMPSHIFTMLGLWRELIEANRKAHAALHAAHDGADSDIGSLHGFDFIAYARLQLADDEEVMAGTKALKERGKSPSLIEARYVLERAAWIEGAALAAPSEELVASAHVAFVRALAQARLRDVKQARQETQVLGALLPAVQKGEGAYWASLVDIYASAADAWIAEAEGRAEDAHDKMAAAADADDAREKHIYLENKLVPMRELLGELLLQQQRPAEALAAFEASLKASPNRFRGFLGAARAAKAAGDDAKARQWYGKLLELVGERNGRAEIAEALAFVGGK